MRVSVHELIELSQPAAKEGAILEQRVVRHAIEPGTRLVGPSPIVPRGERRHHRRLNGVLDELEVLRAHPAHEHGHEPAILVPKEVLDEDRRGQGPTISRTSQLDPGRMSPGHSLAMSSARS